MRNIEKKSLIIAIAFTLLFTSILMYIMQSKTEDKEKLVPVVVVTSDIKAKTEIKDSDLTIKEVPESNVPRGSISKKESVIGKIVRDNIYYGEILLTQNLVSSKNLDGIAAVIKEGYRAISVQIDPVKGVGGLIKQGDFVDLMVFLRKPYVEDDSIYTVFQNIEVLDIRGNNSEYLVLSMTPQESEELFLVDKIGDIRFVLRQIADRNKLDLPGTNIEFLNPEEILNQEE